MVAREALDREFRNIDYLTMIFCVFGILSIFMLWWFSLVGQTGLELIQDRPLFIHIDALEKLLLIIPVIPIIVLAATLCKKFGAREDLIGTVNIVCGVIYLTIWFFVVKDAVSGTNFMEIFGVGCYIELIAGLFFVAAGINHIENARSPYPSNRISSLLMCIAGAGIGIVGIWAGFDILFNIGMTEIMNESSGAFTIMIIFGAFLFLLGFIRLRKTGYRDHIDRKKAIQYIAMFGGLLAVLAFFDCWGINTYAGIGDRTYTGINIVYTLFDSSDFVSVSMLIGTIVAYCSFTLIILHFVDKVSDIHYSRILTIMGLIMVIMFLVFLIGSDVDHLGTGAYMSLAGGIIVLVIGLTDIFFGDKMESPYAII